MKWLIYHKTVWGVRFIDLYEGKTAKEAKESFKKTVKWSHKTRITTIKKYRD